MQLESYRSTSGPLEFRLSVFSTLVSTRHLRKSADSIRDRARSGMALRRQHPRKGPCRRVQSDRRTSCTSHGTHQGRSKHQDSCPGQRALHKLSSLPCPLGTTPTFHWQKSSLSACQKTLHSSPTKPMIALHSDTQRALEE